LRLQPWHRMRRLDDATTLMSAILWTALGLLAIASAVPKPGRFIPAGAGWLFLSIHWFQQPSSYIELDDYFNVFLVILAALVSLFIAYISFTAGKAGNKADRDVIIPLSRAASVAGLIYFLFADVEIFNTGIISLVTNQAIWVTKGFGYPVAQVAWNQLAVNGMAVEIILACTAIESIALFLGLISSATGASASRKMQAFIVSVPVIYALNLVRVSFTASAYGFAWFGTPDESFHISEHFITKAGSMVALLLISYVVLRMLPEVAETIDGTFKMVRVEFKRMLRYN